MTELVHELGYELEYNLMTSSYSIRRSNHGGKRNGAGRKASGPSAMVRVTVTLPPEVVEQLRQAGEGNVSAGIRILVTGRKT